MSYKLNQFICDKSNYKHEEKQKKQTKTKQNKILDFYKTTILKSY